MPRHAAADPSPDDERFKKRHRTDDAQLKPGDWVGGQYYGRITGPKDATGKYPVKDLQGHEFRMSSGIFTEQTFSADQVQETIKVTPTEMAWIMNTMLGDAMFTVMFRKQVKPEDIVAKLRAVPDIGDTLRSARHAKKLAASLLEGEERVLTGIRHSVDPVKGRSKVRDVAIDGPDHERQVDHRTVQWLVLRGVKYELK